MELTDAQKKRMLAAADVVENGDLAVLAKIMEFQEFLEKYEIEESRITDAIATIAEMRTMCEQCMTDSKSDKTSLSGAVSDVSGRLQSLSEAMSSSVSRVQLDSAISRFTGEIQSIRNAMPEMPDMSLLADRLVEIEAKIPVFTEYVLKPENVRDGLETLKGDERLDRSAVKGLDTVVDQKGLDRAIGILDQRTSFLVQRVSNLQSSIDAIQSSGGTGGSPSIGGAVTGGTAGSILFVNPDGILAQDNANLFWDSSNKWIGLGTQVPTNSVTFSQSMGGIDNYNTADQVTNFERVRESWVSNVYTFESQSGGTGTTRNFNFSLGRVGIGTPSPGVKLHVLNSGTAISSPTTGTVAIFQNTNDANSDAIVAITSGTNALAQLYLGDTASASVGRITYSNTSNAMIFYTNGTESARITSAGFLGIGTGSTVGAVLHTLVSGTSVTIANSSGIFQRSSSGQTAQVNIVGPDNGIAYLSLGGTTTPTEGRVYYDITASEMRLYTNSSVRQNIGSSGTTFGGGAISATHTITLPSVSTGIAFYNTVDQTVNYERVREFWSGNVFNWASEAGGTGTRRNFQVSGGTMTALNNGILNASVPTLIVANASPATTTAAATQQWSPALSLVGQGWKTAATAGSVEVRFNQYVSVLSGTSLPSGTWTLTSMLNGGTENTLLTVGSTTGNVIASGNVFATGILSNFNGSFSGNFLTGASGSIATTTTASGLFGGSSTVAFRVSMAGNTAGVLVSGYSAANLLVGSTTFTTAASGNNPVIANAVVKTPGTITVNGTATVTATASLYVEANASTAGTGNYALWSAGISRIDGDLILPTASSGAILTSPGGTAYRLTVDNAGVLVTTAV